MGQPLIWCLHLQGPADGGRWSELEQQSIVGRARGQLVPTDAFVVAGRGDPDAGPAAPLLLVVRVGAGPERNALGQVRVESHHNAVRNYNADQCTARGFEVSQCEL